MLGYFSSKCNVVYMLTYIIDVMLCFISCVLDLLMCALSVQEKLAMDLNRGPSTGTYVYTYAYQGLVYIKRHGPRCYVFIL